MAKFSLTLINNRGATVLTQYDALTNETAGLTFDENLQLSVDGSTLSFSMLKYLYEGSQKVTNTAALSIIYGSIIRCEYNTKRYDFAITDIKYNFMSENLRLDFTATDYFQFENSQIGVGYTITTDTTDPEYLGAMPIDEWVYKIIRDNNIRWTYTPINTANQDVINILNNADERTALYDLAQDETEYWEEVKESKTLNTWVSFECSNSSAFAALKQLATDNELIIEVNYSNHSFCFKPQKSFIFNGYYFNPSNNLQAFSVQGNADNLITVLNITGGKDLNNQEITLVPSIPESVMRFINSDEWLQSVYYPNLYDNYAADYPQFVREIAYTPWFENKLIDVSYFTNNNLLLPTEVFEIQDILYNQLRRVNARLIIAETAYLQKYEQDYMDINQKRIDAETLNARLYGDINVLTKPADYTKPPIFITKADNGNIDLGPQNWIYIAPGSQLYAQTASYNGIVDYNSLAYCDDSSITYNAPLYNYLGTTTNVTTNVAAFSVTQATWSCTCNGKTLTLASMSGSTGIFLNNVHSDGEVLYNRFGKYVSEISAGTATKTLSATISYPSNSRIRFAAQCKPTVGAYFSTEAVFDIIEGSPILVSQTGFSEDPTLSGNNFNGSLSLSSRIINFEYEILELEDFVICNSTSTLRLSYENGMFRYRIGYSSIYLTAAVLDNVIYYQKDGSYAYLDFYGSIASCRLLKVDSTSHTTLPQYIYVKSNLPDTIQLYTKVNNRQSNTLKITPDNIANIVSTSLYESQFPATPDHAIAGLADHLNSFSATRFAMLQHLADNWGYFQTEWNKSFTYDNSNYILGELYATYRQIGITDNPNYEILAVDQPWSTSISDKITATDLSLLHLLLGIPDTRDLTRTAVITNLQNLHTKFTEYWQQCYNAAMSIGIYWPSDWDCIDVLKTNKDTIDAIIVRSMPLLYGNGIVDNDLRWQPGSLLLNYCFVPLLQDSTYSYTNTIPLETITKTIPIGGQTNNGGIKVVDAHIQFSRKVQLEIKYQSVNCLKATTSTSISLGSVQLENTTLYVSINYLESYHQWCLVIHQEGTTVTDITTKIDITLYQITDFSTPSSIYAESYKFLDDNNNYRPIYTPQVDNTQFIYRLFPQTNIEPFNTILSKHTADDSLHLYHADLRYKEEHYINFLFDNCKLPSQWLAAAVPFTDAAAVKPTGASNDVGNPNLALITYLAKASQYNNTEYYEYLHQHNELWQHMYQRFPGIFRESNFTNTTAITSQELYESARRELDKVSQPAYQYSLTGMDIYMHDSDYEPTRIKLGDQIRIDYQELNELNDSLNAALREPLYITGITHTLRNDGDYQFTVTTRSATDTMLQRFANILMFK